MARNCEDCGKKLGVLGAVYTIERNGRTILLCWDCKKKFADLTKEKENTKREESFRTLQDKANNKEAYRSKLDEITISTGDIRREYEILDVLHVFLSPFDFAEAVFCLRDQAYKLGADAIVYLEFDTVVYSTYKKRTTGMDLSKTQFSEDHIALNAYGTAIRFT